LVTAPLISLAVVCRAEVPGAVVQKALAGDWEAVHAALTADDSRAADPVARLLGAHACLATNASNEATALLLSTGQGEDAQRWLQWTIALQTAHPDSPVALYLAADAQARAGSAEAAERLLDRALELDPELALAWNARGALKTLDACRTDDEDLRDQAVTDLYQAITRRPDFIAAHLSLGYFYYLGSVVPPREGAEPPKVAGFDDALKLDPECALAYLGRGCIEFGMSDYDQAARDFATAHLLCPPLTAALANHSITELYAQYSVELDAATRELVTGKPGTTLNMKTIMEGCLQRLDTQNQNLRASLAQVSGWADLRHTDFLLASVDDIRGLANQYGRMNVMAAAQLQKNTGLQSVLEFNARSQETLSSFQRWQAVESAGRFLQAMIPFAERGRDLATKGLEGLTRGARKSEGERLLGWYVPWTKLITDTGEAFTNPVVSTAKSLSSILTAWGSDMAGARATQLGTIGMQVRQKALEGRLIDWKAQTALSPPQASTTGNLARIPAYYAPADSPVTVFGVMPGLFNTLEKGSRIAILDPDPLSTRSRVASEGLRRRGFDPLILPPDTTPQRLQEFGVGGLIGIQVSEAARRTSLFSADSVVRPSGPAAQLPKMSDDYRRFFIPPDGGGGHGGGGGAVSLPGLPSFSPLPTTPTLPGPTPGGVLVRFAVGKGDWPVMAFSSLLYEGAVGGAASGGEAQ
jgi:tetratricopeptide (TPR) repeat protein